MIVMILGMIGLCAVAEADGQLLGIDSSRDTEAIDCSRLPSEQGIEDAEGRGVWYLDCAGAYFQEHGPIVQFESIDCTHVARGSRVDKQVCAGYEACVVTPTTGSAGFLYDCKQDGIDVAIDGGYQDRTHLRHCRNLLHQAAKYVPMSTPYNKIMQFYDADDCPSDLNSITDNADFRPSVPEFDNRSPRVSGYDDLEPSIPDDSFAPPDLPGYDSKPENEIDWLEQSRNEQDLRDLRREARRLQQDVCATQDASWQLCLPNEPPAQFPLIGPSTADEQRRRWQSQKEWYRAEIGRLECELSGTLVCY